MHELVNKMVKALPKARGTPLSSYLAHLYHHFELLRKEEVVNWETKERIQEYKGTELDFDSKAYVPELLEPFHRKPVRQMTHWNTTLRNLDDRLGRRKRAHVDELKSS
jgi:hypothetical protein